MAKTRRDSDQILLRLPDGLRDRVKTAAERNGRSMTAEIVGVLEREFPPATYNEKVVELISALEGMYILDGLKEDDPIHQALIAGVRGLLENVSEDTRARAAEFLPFFKGDNG